MGNQLSAEQFARQERLIEQIFDAIETDRETWDRLTDVEDVDISKVFEFLENILPETIDVTPPGDVEEEGGDEPLAAACTAPTGIEQFTASFQNLNVRRTKRKIPVDLESSWLEGLHEFKSDGMEKRPAGIKGDGMFATKIFERNEFVCEYVGEWIPRKEGLRRDQLYTEADGSFLFFIDNFGCIDATAKKWHDYPGRYINHSKKNFNVVPKLCRPEKRLYFVAAREIAVGEELAYDYNDKSKESLKNHPWLKE